LEKYQKQKNMGRGREDGENPALAEEMSDAFYR